ncbi:MAG: hypothetical protein AAGA96_00905 [Verrucomicrobiota bacterium]
MTTPPTAEIVEWNPESGSGYLGFDEKIVAIQARDFLRFHRRPVPGDRVLCDLTFDEEYQPIAVDLRLLRARGLFYGMSRAWPALLLVLPIVAALSAPLPASGWHFLAYFFLMSAATFMLYQCEDFLKKGLGRFRTDSVLHLLELLGGWAGSVLALRLMEEDEAEDRYRLFLWISVGLWQALSLEATSGWLISRNIGKAVLPVLQVANPFA